jgi:predicted transporter
MDSLPLTLAVLIGIALFGVKSGLGCGLTSLKKEEIVMISTAYLILSMVFSILSDMIPISATRSLLSMGLFLHTLLAIMLVIGGLYTAREFWKGRDVSRKSFLLLSIPCPVCMAATFFACSILIHMTDTTPLQVGFAVGITFILTITTTVLLARKVNSLTRKGPYFLGNVMLFLGMFYILAALLIPAYIQSRGVLIETGSMDVGNVVVSFSMLSGIVLVGFLLSRFRGVC